MALKKYKPTTSSQRFKVISAFDEVTASKPEKSLLAPKKRSGGRNNEGKMTMRYIGGGHKQRYRIIDFKRDKYDVPAKVVSLEYDPNRTSNIALLQYADGEKRYNSVGVIYEKCAKKMREQYGADWGTSARVQKIILEHLDKPYWQPREEDSP